MRRNAEETGCSKDLGRFRRLLCRSQLAMLFIVLLAFGLAGNRGFAQAVNATLRGTVKDNSGASVVGAKVTLSEPATGRVVRQAVTSATGDYEFDELLPGTYELRCDQTGFKSFTAQDILLDPGQVRRVDPVLAVGAQRLRSLCRAGAAVMNTETAAISTTFSLKDNNRTPLVNIYPSAYSLLTTASGVQGGYGGFPVMNGEQQTNESQIFDRIPNDLQGEQNNNSNFFDETSVTTSNAPAESAVPADLIDHPPRDQCLSWRCELQDL